MHKNVMLSVVMKQVNRYRLPVLMLMSQTNVQYILFLPIWNQTLRRTAE